MNYGASDPDTELSDSGQPSKTVSLKKSRTTFLTKKPSQETYHLGKLMK